MSNELAIQDFLDEFPADAKTFKLVKGIFKVVPYSPDLGHYASVDDAVRALKPDASAAEIAEARRIAAEDPEIGRVLWMARLMDVGDSGYAIATGLSVAWQLFKGNRTSDVLETDTQQRNDAVLKALGLAYMVWKAYPGTTAEKVEAFRTNPAGQALAVYYGSIEVALPFADNALSGTGNLLEDLFSKHGDAGTSSFTALAGGDEVGGVKAMLMEMKGQLNRVVEHASKYTEPVAASAKQYLPGVMDGADKVAGVIANAADVMPVYRLLGARLAAEAAAMRALGTSA